jgi:hypothetical protein
MEVQPVGITNGCGQESRKVSVEVTVSINFKKNGYE